MMQRMIRVCAIGLSLAASVAAPAAAQTVDEIVALNHASKGGLNKWRSIQTQRLEGVASAQGIELTMVIHGKRPNLGRQDLSIEIPGQGVVNMTNIFDGTSSWMINPMMGSAAPQQMTGPEADSVRDQSDFDGALVDYKTKGYTVELVGPAAVGARKAHHLKVTRGARPTQHYYIDAQTGAELKVSTEAGAGPAIDTEMSNFKAVEGVLVPHSIKVSQGGMIQAELLITKVEFNVAIDDAMFKVK